MSDPNAIDEMLLIDFLRGELSAQQHRQVQERLQKEESFRRLRDDLANTFSALDLVAEAETPGDLAERTLARLRQARRTEALLVKEQSRRPMVSSTFSLRELSVAAAAILLMVAVLVPSLRQARHRAEITRCASNAGQIGSALLTYSNANEDYLPSPDSNSRRWLPSAGQVAASSSSALFKLVRHGYATPVIFRCPSGGHESFVARAGMMDFPEQEYISYSYQHTLGPRGLRRSDPRLQAVAQRMAVLADSTPVFSEGRFHREHVAKAISKNHGREGQNVLYLDMHVDWSERPTVGVSNDNIFLIEGVTDYRGDEQPSRITDTFLLPSFTPGR